MAQVTQDTPLLNGVVTNGTDNETSGHNEPTSEPDPQALVIESLRSQVQDLFSQVTQLNSKLVQSYDRVSTLEDDLHEASSTIRSTSLQISQLELERTQHLSALNTGLLVEKSQVTAELTRLMEKASEEASQRGQAESARADIEKDLDDLSASLFSQANTMVAEARLAQAQSERKVEQAELALKGAEDAVATMQQHMQALQREKEDSDRQAEDMRVIMGKGKWIERSPQGVPTLRLLSSHLPYQEFLLFVAHLRSIHQVSLTSPAMSTLLPLPFLARLLTEDSDPTVRLDLAPSLNWLSRRSVLSAIYTGQLVIEPMSSATLLKELSSPSFSNSSLVIPGINSSNTNVSCALCGSPIFPSLDSQSKTHTYSRSSTHPLTLSRSWSSTSTHTSASSWSASALFKTPLSYSMSTSSDPQVKLPIQQTSHNIPTPLPQQVHIFRLSVVTPTPSQSIPFPPVPFATPGTSQPQSTSKQINHQPAPSRSQSTIYPLCNHGWCLTRLRATCSLWAFVRTGVVDKIWEEDVPVLPSPPQSKSNAGEKDASKQTGGKPPVPPRRRGLWGMASALSERAASWSEGDKERTKDNKVLPPPPPFHPSTKKNPSAAPPPLPKRSEGRGKNLPPDPAPVVISVPLSPVAIGTIKVNEPLVDDTQITDENPGLGAPRISTPTTTSTESDGGKFSTPSEELTSFPNQASNSNPPEDSSDPPGPGKVVESPPQTPTLPTSNSTLHQATRTASPAPPPLPRRAAARSQGAIPSTSLSEVQVPAVSGPIELDSSTSAVEVHPVEVKTPASEPAAQPDTPKEGNSQSVPGPSDPNAPESSSPEGNGEVMEPQNVVNGNRGNETSDEQSGSGPASSTSSTPAPDPEKAMVPVNGAAADSSGKFDVNGKHQDGNIDAGSEEVYIGDATWEERTWKELVKLREDLFWARIGCLRT